MDQVDRARQLFKELEKKNSSFDFEAIRRESEIRSRLNS